MANKKPSASFKKNDPRINRAGRPPKESSLSDILREKADAGKLADALLKVAYTGDVAALKAVYDRIDGRPRESIEVDTHIDNAAKIDEIRRMLENAKPIESAD
jgi:hypothetical protein